MDEQIDIPEYPELHHDSTAPHEPQIVGDFAVSRRSSRGAVSALKVPPHSVDAEQSVLGGLMLDNDAWFNVAEVVQVGDFYRAQHQIIFEAMTDLAGDDQPMDALTVSERLQSKGMLDKAGGIAYLAELTEATPGASNVVAYAKIVRELSTLRQLIGAANRIAESAFARDGRPSEELLDLAEKEVFQISEGRLKGGGPEKVVPLLNRAVERIERLYATRNPITGLATGFDLLDKKTAGLQPSDLVIVAGRPSMGKTSFAMNMAEHAVMESDGAVLVFSMEMPSEQLVLRMLSSLGRIDQTRMRTGDMHEDDWPRFTSAVSQLKDKQLFIDDTPALTPNDLRTRARRVARECGGLALIVVDYLQLMRAPGSADNRTNEISEISRSLKAIAKEMSCPLIALSQLNRGLESRTDKRPVMADLRECVVGDTLVNLADGRRVPIRSLVGTEPEVFAMAADQKIVRARAEKVWSVGRRQVLNLKLASGRKLVATAKHRLFTADGWQTLGTVAIGDRVALARQLPVDGEPGDWDEERLALLGHLVGDGSYLSGRPLRYTTASEENSELVKRIAETRFGVRVNRHDGPGNWHQLVFSGNGNRWHPRGINAWLRDLGLFNQRSAEKHLPESVFSLPDALAAHLLRHLWATDGCLHVRDRGGASRIYFSTCSQRLAADVTALLLQLGIVARIRSVVQKRSLLYNVDVSGREAQIRFLDEVGAFGPKVEAANELRRLLESRSANTNVDTLPREVFDRVQALMRAQGVTQRAMAALRGTAYGGSSHFKFAPSRETLSSYADLLGSEALRTWATSDLFWDRVVAVEPAGEAEVFDLTVPGPASWLADGVVSHNSGAIEQDADLILFIYRDEVYNSESPDKGTAEIIIGKQRNGPIGSLRLAFIGNLTKFENLAPERYNDYTPFE
ncbi:MAG: replicative DNA helicase [Pseudomonadales bacterium]